MLLNGCDPIAVWLLILLSVIVIRYAIAMSLQNKQRVIYTTPIKVSTQHTCKMRAIAKILRCRVNASSRRGTEWPGSPFAVADLGEGPGGRSPPPPPIFRPNWGLKGWKQICWRPPPTLPPPPYLKIRSGSGAHKAGENPLSLLLSQQAWQWLNWIKILITWRVWAKMAQKS